MTVLNRDALFSAYRADLAESGVSFSLVTMPSLAFALTGVWLEVVDVLPERRPWLLVSTERPPVMLVPHIEAPLAGIRNELEELSVRSVQDEAERFEQVGECLKDSVGAGFHASAMAGSELMGLQALQVPWSDVGELNWQSLRRKAAVDRDSLSALASSLESMLDALDGIAATGRTEEEIAQRLRQMAAGAPGPLRNVHPIVSSEANLLIPHAPPSDRVLGDGDLCRLGIRTRLGPYHGMLTRSAVSSAGRLSFDSGLLATVIERQQSLVESMRPDDTFVTCRRRLGRLEGDLREPVEMVAHGMGFEFKEPPLLSAESSDTAAAGDILLASTILEDSVGRRLYRQELVRLGEETNVRLGAPQSNATR